MINVRFLAAVLICLLMLTACGPMGKSQPAAETGPAGVSSSASTGTGSAGVSSSASTGTGSAGVSSSASTGTGPIEASPSVFPTAADTQGTRPAGDKWGAYSKDAGESIYDAYDVPSQLDDAVAKESDPIAFLCSGMSYPNPVIRWYCANRIIDYYDKPGVKDAVQPLKLLLGDQDENVRDSAALSIAILDGTYENGHIIRSHSGSRYLFMKYNGPRYNNSKLWLAEGGKISCIVESYSIGGFGWSPDDKWLYANPFGRIQSETLIKNIESRKEYYIGLFEYIHKNSEKLGYKTGNNQRPDPWIKFLEWSPDSSRLLLSYWFRDDDYTGQLGIAVYNIAKQSFDKITPLGPTEGDYLTAEKPAGFKWN